MNGDGFGIGWYHTNVAVYSDLNAISHDGTSNAPVPPSSMSAPTSSSSLVSNGSSNHLNGLSHSRHAAPMPILPKRVVGLDEDGNPVASAAVFKDVFPAWNNTNLRELCMATSSDCIMAHVRAASKGTGVSHQNCHPFKAGRLLFCHNGRVFEFYRFRRRFKELLSDEAYNSIMGTTDSEIIFALLLTNLDKDGKGTCSPFEQTKPFGAKRLVAALKKTINQTQRMIEEFGPKHGYSTFNFALTDGESMVVTRFCDKGAEIPPPSLYFAFGDAQSLYKELTDENPKPLFSSKHSASSLDVRSGMDNKSDSSVHSEGNTDSGSVDSDGFDERAVFLHDYASRPGKIMEDVDPATAAFIVSSNPLTRTHTWHPMPRNSIMWCSRGSHPELSVLKRRSTTMMNLTDLKL